MRAYVKTIATATSAGSTTLPDGLKITKIQNDTATNFVTLSFDGAIAGGTNPEGKLLTGTSWDFSGVDGVTAETLYHKADSGAVNVTIIGFIN